MAKSFKILQEQLHAKMTPEQKQRADEQFNKMLDELNTETFEPDVIEWLQKQNAHTKHYVNELIRNVMRLQMG